MKKQTESIWKTPEEYFLFGIEHKVWGEAANKLKVKLDKQSKIPEPKLEKIKE